MSIDKKDDGCIFCAKPLETDDTGNFILLRGEKSFIILNAFPYSNGHLLIVPYLHTPEPALLDTAASVEVWNNIVRCKRVLEKVYGPDGFNIGMNVGRTAGAGIEGHLHVHVVPRWNGDTNFMPVLGETRVISQGLSDTYDALLPWFRDQSRISSGAAPSR